VAFAGCILDKRDVPGPFNNLFSACCFNFPPTGHWNHVLAAGTSMPVENHTRRRPMIFGAGDRHQLEDRVGRACVKLGLDLLGV
jgi:hypothetical protein